MCESECDTDGDTGGFAAQNADHASVDRWLLRYRGNKQEMENEKLGSFQTNECQTVLFEILFHQWQVTPLH